MFIIIYVVFFTIFVLVGFFVGKKYQEYFYNYKKRSFSEEEISENENIISDEKNIDIPKEDKTTHIFDKLDFEEKYDKIIKVYNDISGLGIKNGKRLDIILCKKESNLLLLEKEIENLITENKVFFKILIIED